MFSRFQSIVNKMRANKAQLPYSDHERALKLLHALDRRVWEVKVSAIIESPNYETLTVDELFSKLKCIEIAHQTQAKIENPSAPTMALVSGGGSASNSSPAMFALSSLLSITEEQVESLGDEELALVASRFTWFHNNRMSRRRGGSKDGCYNCGDLDHFVASCPKKGKSDFGPRDHHSGRRKGKYSSGKYKSKVGFNKEALKKNYLHKAKIKEHAFLASLSDLDHDSDDVVSSSSDEETERRVEDKLNGMCFIADTAGGFCTMALGEDVVGASDDSTSEVLPSADHLAAGIEELNAALVSQDKLLRQATRERREFRSKFESMLRELESARASIEVSNETECDECALHMSNITTLQTKYSTLLDERGELRSRSILLGACIVCPSLQSELADRDARIALLEKASSVSASAPTQCALCEGLQYALESCRHDKTRIEEENTYLRSILSWVSCSEPQLGMMVS
jgi:ferredoxin